VNKQRLPVSRREFYAVRLFAFIDLRAFMVPQLRRSSYAFSRFFMQFSIARVRGAQRACLRKMRAQDESASRL